MLEVHAPHETIHTWKDFLIHIATIVLGLCIAVGLEQTVEYVHHNHQRHQLREDLRNEAEQRIRRLKINQKINASDIAWYREILRLGRETKPSGGIVTFVLPSPPSPGLFYTGAVNGVWSAAKASGSVAVLSPQEIEAWDYVDAYNSVVEKSLQGREEALKVFYGFGERIGTRPAPGATLRLTPDGLDELMRAVARLLEDTWILERDNASWEGLCEAVLDGAKTDDQREPYARRAQSSMPQ